MSPKEWVYRIVASGLPTAGGRRGQAASDAIGIIMVHGVHDEPASGPEWHPTSSVSLRAFEANVRSLMRRFSFVSMDDAASMLRGETPWREHCVALTFDDSLKCLVELVAPKLKAWGVPATFYVSTDAIDRQRPYWWLRIDYALSKANGQSLQLDLLGSHPLAVTPVNRSQTIRRVKDALRHADTPECERVASLVESQVKASLADDPRAYELAGPMSWGDVIKLNELGMTVGSHTVRHPNVALLEAEDLRHELEGSRRLLQEKGGRVCRHFCYPYGAHSELACGAVEAAGYSTAVTTIGPGWNRLGDNAFRLHRFSMPAQAYKLPYVMSDAYQLLHQRWGLPHRGRREPEPRAIANPR